jgi:hypothetical protein
MRFNALPILSLLILVIAAPIVDATVCDDCKHIMPLQDMQLRSTSGADHSNGQSLSSDEGHPSPQRTSPAQDLCPVCSNIAAAMVNACCSAPSMISHTNPFPKLIAFSDPTYSITKPPQN